jgi:hypothetical protein
LYHTNCSCEGLLVSSVLLLSIEMILFPARRLIATHTTTLLGTGWPSYYCTVAMKFCVSCHMTASSIEFGYLLYWMRRRPKSRRFLFFVHSRPSEMPMTRRVASSRFIQNLETVGQHPLVAPHQFDMFQSF